MQEPETQTLPHVIHSSESEAIQHRRMTTSEAAQEVGVSTSTIRRWVARGYLDATRTAAGFLVDASGLATAQARAQSKRKPAVQGNVNSEQHDQVVSEQPSTGRATRDVSQGTPQSATQQVAAATELSTRYESEPRALAPSPTSTRPIYQSDPRRLLEGLQRGIILEQAKYQRAQRRKDDAAIERSAWRLVELQERFESVRAAARADRGAGDSSIPSTSPLRALHAQVTAAAHARVAPARRMLSASTLLILNGVLMMLMTFIA